MRRKLHLQSLFCQYQNSLKAIILIVLIQFITLGNAVAQNKPAELDKLMKHCYANSIFNGTVLVSENGKVIYRKAFGYANNEKKQKLTPESSFDLASVSKQFTAVGIMILEEKNKLSYNDKLIKYFPEFPAYANDITIRNLLNHTSGLPQYYSFTDKENPTNSEVLKILTERTKPDFKTGEKFAYNNGGYIMLALLIEKISGESLAAFMKENIFDPLKMKNTLVYTDPEFKIKNRAIGYNRLGETDDFKISRTGSTGIFSNVDDLFLWEQSLYTEKLVSKKTMNEAFTGAFLKNGALSTYGFGWRISKNKQQKLVEHSGSQFGYRTFIKRNMTQHNSYILLTNNGDAIALNEINLAIDNILSSTPYVLPKIPVFSKLQEYLKNNTTDLSIEMTRKAIQETPDDFVIDDDGINELGYQYVNNKKVDEGLALFKFNAEINPKSSNVYDSLGQLYLAVSDTVNAIENYKKSVALDPDNDRAIKILTGLGVSSAEITQEIIVPAEVLKTYEGKYQLNYNYYFTVTSENKQLFIQGTGEPITIVFPISQNRFYSKAVTAQFTFNKDKNGKIDSLTLNMGSDIMAKKVE